MTKQKVIKMLAAWMLMIVSFAAKAQTSTSILGRWKDAAHPEKQLEISNQTGTFVGKAINSAEPAENGKVILKNLVWSDVSKTYSGVLINPANGDELSIVINMVGIDHFRFTVGKFIFSRTFNFKRITP